MGITLQKYLLYGLSFTQGLIWVSSYTPWFLSLSYTGKASFVLETKKLKLDTLSDSGFRKFGIFESKIYAI